MTVIVPPFSVVDAIESGQCAITRRIEIYETDGETPWYPSVDEELILRLVSGGVSVDASRPERRTLDLILMNDDNLLRPNPNGGFWYDKVIKCYRGISYTVPISSPKITIVEQAVLYGSQKFKLALGELGFTRTFINLGATSWSDVDSDIIVSYTETDPTDKADLLLGQYYSGRAVLTFSTGNTEAEVPLIDAGSATGSQTWGVTPVSTDTPVAGQWVTGSAPGTATGYGVTALATGALAIAVWSSGGGPTTITGSLQTNAAGGRWVDLHLPSFDSTGIKQLLSAVIQWLSDYTPTDEWETQIGEFCIDGLSDQHFPYQLKVTARDYMKRPMLSKLSQDETYVSGTVVTDLIRDLARNSGITNTINVATLSNLLTVDLSYTRGTPRSEIIIAAANGIGQQLYFNAFGELTMEPLPDPTLDPTIHTFQTGKEGNLVSYDRATNDSNLFNHIAVYGSPGGSIIPFFGEAKNTDANSPTRIEQIGDRYYDYQFDTVTSDNEAAALALKFLKVSALETYELNFSSITYPWLEANTIAKILDPSAESFEPKNYLMDSLNIPLALGPMSATGKRITLVGDSG